MGCASSSKDKIPVVENGKQTEGIKKMRSLGKGNFSEVFLIKSNLDKKKKCFKRNTY